MAESNYYDQSLILEDTVTLDGSGNYYTSWLPTNDSKTVRVTGYGFGSGVTMTIQHAHETSNGYFVAPPSSITQSAGAFTGDVGLGARYFRLRADSGTANATARLTIRTVERVS